MDFEILNMTSQEHQKLSKTLKTQGLSESQINNILNGEFSTFEQSEELSKVFGNNSNFQTILQYLSDGYTIDELESKGVKSIDIEKFKTMLNACNLTIENAKAINQYSNGSNMILSVKRGSASRTDIKQGIINDLTSKLQERGIDERVISEIQRRVLGLNYQRPLYENYDILRSIFSEYHIPNNCYPTINTAIKHLNSFQHIDETIEQLDDGLSKSRIPQSMKLYRAVKSKSTTNVAELSSKVGENKGYTSTSPIYDSSFAKYDEYDTVMELYVPKGTKGAYITPFSDYDSTEQEVLLDSNDVFFIDIQTGVVDKNGKTKNVLKGIVLSKNRECYKDLGTQSKEQDYIRQDSMPQTESGNLPVKQNKFSQLWSQLRAKFLKRKPRATTLEEKAKYETQEPNSKRDNNYIKSLKQQTYTKGEIVQNDVRVSENLTIEKKIEHGNEIDSL